MHIIQKYRNDNDLSRKALAEMVDVSAELVRLWEKEERLPGPHTAIRVEEATGGGLTRKMLRPDLWA